jgi:hypothetical protein
MSAVTRRTALQSLGAASLLGGVALRAESRARLVSAGKAPLLLVDASLTSADLGRVAARVSGAHAVRLEGDLVQLWRQSLQQDIQRHGAPVAALVRWDKSLILAGLAREQRWRVSTQRLSQSVFRVVVTRV